jgi:thioesterase superfamily protein
MQQAIRDHSQKQLEQEIPLAPAMMRVLGRPPQSLSSVTIPRWLTRPPAPKRGAWPSRWGLPKPACVAPGGLDDPHAHSPASATGTAKAMRMDPRCTLAGGPRTNDACVNGRKRTPDIDATCAVLNLPQGATTTTIESKTNFFRPLRGGCAHALTTPLHVGRTLVVVQTDVRDDEKRRIALVTQTQAVLAGRS